VFLQPKKRHIRSLILKILRALRDEESTYGDDIKIFYRGVRDLVYCYDYSLTNLVHELGGRHDTQLKQSLPRVTYQQVCEALAAHCLRLRHNNNQRG
jgi:hypothetical protein